MADPIGTSSALLALVAFAFQSSKLLYQAVESFQSNPRVIRELKEELEALDGVLQSLQETAMGNDADFTMLKLPLLRCGKACEDFKAVIVKCTAHSNGPRTSFRDWAKLKYMGEDIVGFRNMLAGYKSTIAIALGGANMRTSTVTASVLKEYGEMITNTTTDLEEHLQEINQKLQELSLPGAGTSEDDVVEQRRIQEERDSTQQCLSICAQVSSHLSQVQLPHAFENISTPPGAYQGPITTLSGLTSARLVTANTFKQCRESFSNTTTTLEKHLQDINNRLKNYSPQPFKTSDEQAAERERIQEEMDSIKQCLAICSQASQQAADQDRTNVFEDISMTDDGHQVIVSTIGDLVSAKRVTAGARSMQLMGQMSDDSLQQFTQHRAHSTAEKVIEPQSGGDTQFKDRYGAGLTLNTLNSKDGGATRK